MVNTNVVLFNKSSNVRSIGYKVKAWDISYEEVGNHLFAVDVENSELNVLREDENPRTDTLEMDKESLWGTHSRWSGSKIKIASSILGRRF